MNRPNKVLYLSHQPECGGAEKSLLDLLGALDRERFVPYLVTSGPGGLANGAAALAVPVHFAKSGAKGLLRRLTGLFHGARTLARLAKTHRFDLLHANTLHGGYLALLARTGLPLVWHLRDLSYPPLALKAAVRADLLIANSHATAGQLPPSLRSSGKIEVIHNGIGSAFFAPHPKPGSVRAELGLARDVPLIGMVGRLTPWKGHIDFLEAAALLNRDVRFVVIGGQPFLDASRDRDYPVHLAVLARARGIADQVHFLGQRADVAPLMADLDLLIHPSSEPEPFGRDIVEAHALGVPVIATNAGGVTEIISDGVSGLLVPPRDPRALARAIQRLLDEPELAKAMGLKGRSQAKRKFTAVAHARTVEEAYLRLLEQSRLSRRRPGGRAPRATSARSAL